MNTTLNKIILLLSAAAILSCDNDKNDISVEQSLEDFSISLKNVSQQSAEIQWSPVMDSQENEMLYDVYLSEGKNFPVQYTQVAKDAKDTSYAFNELTSCVDYYVYIDAHDSKGNVNRQSFSFKTNCNLPPTDFEVTINVNEENTSAVVNWSQAADPEGDKVLYDVYLNNELIVKDLSTLTYTLSDLSYVNGYVVTIVAKDNDGAKRRVHQFFKTCAPDISGVYLVISSDIGQVLYPNLTPMESHTGGVRITKNEDGTYMISDITAGLIVAQLRRVRSTFTVNFPATITDDCGNYTASVNNVMMTRPTEFIDVDLEGNFNPKEGTIEVTWTAKIGIYPNIQKVRAVYIKIL